MTDLKGESHASLPCIGDVLASSPSARMCIRAGPIGIEIVEQEIRYNGALD